MSGVGVIIQARTGSTRLKNKILIPFYQDQGILEILIDKILHGLTGTPVVLATSTNKENDVLADLAARKGINCFRGDEADVLKRFIEASRHYKIAGAVRVCADNPFLDAYHLSQLVNYAEAHEGFDYISFQLSDGRPAIKSHHGFFAEFVKLSALEKVQTVTTEPCYLEHVTNYIYENPADFNIKWLPAPRVVAGRLDIRLTIDTEDDFKSAQEILKLLGKTPLQISLNEIIEVVDHHPMLITKMEGQIKANEK